MAVTESLRALGSWSISLGADTPKNILDALDYFGHVTIHTGRVDPRIDGDSLLRSSRYTGVYRGKGSASDRYDLTGPGMSVWLGDEDDKGDLIEAPISFATTPFQDTITQLLPPGQSVRPGTIFNVAKNYSGSFSYQSRRKAIDYVCETLGCEWRVNGDATLDAGLESDLYRVLPRAALVPRFGSAVDMFLRSFAGDLSTAQDLDDFTTRVLMLASGTEAATVTATADIDPAKNIFKDLFGNPVRMTRVVSESSTDATNAQARAQLNLNRFSGTRDSISCSTSDYDLKGDVVVGDYMFVYAPDQGVFDMGNEVTFLGDRMYPMRLRLVEMSWPVVAGMAVSFRDSEGRWYDLTPYVQFESGSSQLVVGGYNRSLTGGADGGPGGSRPVADNSVPAAPAWVEPFVYSVYQSQAGNSRAQVQLKWTRPDNIDGTTILDGDHYEIRYRSSAVPIFPSTHRQMAARTHAQLAAGTHAQPIVYTPGPWQTLFVPFTDLSTLLQDLPTNMPYEAQIRAVDGAKPPNAGDWSPTTVFQTSGDTLPPATPAPPTIAANRLSVQITHTLGRADGGTYNLDPDLHHFEVHGGYEPLFTPDESTLLGKVLANNAMIVGRVPAVGTVPIESTAPVYFKVIAVDENGNGSPPSAAVQATALLVDNAHISDLTVSKITAGTITADWIVGARIKTANGGARVEMSPDGIQAYDIYDTKTVDIKSADGSVTITGKLQTGTTGQRIIVDPNNSGYARILMYDNTTTNYVSQEVFGGNFQIQARKVSDTSPNGGRLLFNLASDGSGSAYLAFQNASSSWHYQVGSDGGHHLKGFFAKVASYGGLGALHVDQVGGSGTSMSYSYGPTYVGTPMPFIEIQGTSGSPPTASSHAVTARSQTGFSIQYPAGNCDVFIWAVRYG